MGVPPPDTHVFMLTCTRTAGTAPERFRVTATDAEHAARIAKRQGLTVLECHLESLERTAPAPVAAAPQPAASEYGEGFDIEPEDAPARPKRVARPAAAPAPQAAVTEPPPAAPPAKSKRGPLIAAGIGVASALILLGAAAGVAALLKKDKPAPPPPASLASAPGDGGDWYASMFASASPSCVTIRTRFGNGSGFAVKPYLICTNAHVVRGDSRRTLTVVQPESGATANVIGVIHFDAYHDIALIAVDKPFPALSIAPAQPVTGESLLAIGSPGLDETTTLENTVSRLLAAKPVTLGHTTMLQLSGSVNPGNSGGPLLNRRGTVAGMVAAKARDKDGIAFSVLPQDIREAMEGVERLTPEQRTQTDRRHAAAALVHRLVYARAYEFSLLREWDSVVDKIPSRSDHIGQALSAARADLDKEPWVQALRDRVRDDQIGPDLEQMEEDGLGFDVVAAIRAFDRAVQEMSVFATYPRGSPLQLREQITRHRNSIAAATAKVCELLSVPEPDWEEEMD